MEENGYVRITDMGIAKILRTENSSDTSGTPGYMAPEVMCRQNHGFAVDRTAVEAHPELEITHEHLNDKTVAGIASKNKPCFSVQYHPEAGPGPNDATYLFDQFSELLKKTTK